MTAARVLSTFYDRVTVFERDDLPAAPASRSAVPQDRHLHLLMARGAQEFEALFPGLLTDMVTERAEPVGDVAFHRFPTSKWHRYDKLVDQFLGAAETEPVLAEWLLRRFSLLDSLYMVSSPALVARTVRHNLRLWFAQRRHARTAHGCVAR